VWLKKEQRMSHRGARPMAIDRNVKGQRERLRDRASDDQRTEVQSQQQVLEMQSDLLDVEKVEEDSGDDGCEGEIERVSWGRTRLFRTLRHLTGWFHAAFGGPPCSPGLGAPGADS
jgi:hypothetical protein